jgi:hypothetical protein
MDDDVKKELANLFAELTALRLLVNEALSIALSHERYPDTAVSLARKDLSDIIERVAKTAISDRNAPEYQVWFVDRVRASVMAQLDSIEKRVSQLQKNRTVQ